MTSSSQKLIDSYEKYLTNDLNKCKKKIEDIEHDLEVIKSYKQKNRKNSDKNNTETGVHFDYLDCLPGHPSTSTTTPIPVQEEYYLISAKQYFMMTDDEERKLDLIVQLFRSEKIENSIIYCNSVKSVENLTTFMTAEGFHVINLIGKNMKTREKIIEDLNNDNKQINALIIVRRIDNLKNVSLFVNFELPSRHSYIKKIGSTQRNVYKYLILNIITNQELTKLMSYEKYYNTKIVALPISS